MKTEALYADVNARAFDTTDWGWEYTSDYGDVLKGYNSMQSIKNNLDFVELFEN